MMTNCEYCKKPISELHAMRRETTDICSCGRSCMESHDEKVGEAEDIVQELIDALNKAYDYITDLHNLYGENLEVYNWHLNGEPEPFDSFVDDYDGHGVVKTVEETLDKIKRHLEVSANNERSNRRSSC